MGWMNKFALLSSNFAEIIRLNLKQCNKDKSKIVALLWQFFCKSSSETVLDPVYNQFETSL